LPGEQSYTPDTTTPIFKMKPTLDSIASAKAKLAEELRQLEQQEEGLRKEQAEGAFAQVMGLLDQFGSQFDAKQRAEIAALVAPKVRAPKKVAPKAELQPKYWLPHTGETWSGRGRPPRSFTAWEGTASHREWKAKHPKEKFPKFPG
jgi:DNA-binding protein H-NS